MNERALLLLALLCAVGGLLTLYVLQPSLDYPAFSADPLQGVARLEGEVLAVERYGNVTYIDVARPQRVVVFEALDLVPGARIEVIGERDGEEIIARRLRTIRVPVSLREEIIINTEAR